MRTRFLSCGLFILLLFTCHAGSELVTVGRCSSAPVIDGKLDDAAWKNSLEISNFIKTRSSGQASSRHSQFFLTYDDEYLYIGIRCYEEMLHPVLNQTELFRAKGQQHDDPQIWRDDLVEIFLAPEYNNPGHYYHLAVNSNGAIWDTITTKQADHWNATAKSAGSIFVEETRSRPDNAGWSCEIALQLNSLGVSKIQPGDHWKANFCRVARTIDESSSWTQTAAGRFHDPGIFGNIEFREHSSSAGKFTPMREIKAGLNRFSGELSPENQCLLEADFGNGTFVEFQAPVNDQQRFNIDFQLDSQNKAYRFTANAKGDPTETFLRSSSLTLRANQKYWLQVRYRGRYQASNVSEKGYSFLTLLQPTAKYQALPLYFPFDTQGKWVTLNASFENATDTTGSLWGLKWTKRNISGTIEIDDLQIIEENSGKNVLSNGDFSQEANHWNVFSRENLVDGYGFQAAYVKLRYRIVDKEQKDLYVSGVFQVKLASEFPLINSRLVQFGDHGLIPIERLHIAANSVERVNLLLRSQQRDQLKQVQIEVVVPEAIRLLPMDQRPPSLPAPRSVKETLRQQDGQHQRVYQLTFGPECVNDARSASNLWFGMPLFFTADTAVTGDAGFLELCASSDDGQKEPVPLRIPVEVLEPLRGRRPNHQLPLILWVYPAQTRQMNSLERQMIHEKIAEAGYNMVPGDADTVAAFRPLGIHTFCMLPTLTISGPYFPGMQAFIQKNPEYAGINAHGRPTQTIDPAIMLAPDNAFLPHFKEVLARFQKVFSDEMHIDYEFPFMPRQAGQLPQGSAVIGFSKRNLQLFQQQYSIPEADLTPDVIFAKHSNSWLDFRSRQVASTLALYNKAIKSVNTKTRFSVYSGYPGHHYGIEWKYVAPEIDLCMVGYGGDDALMMRSISQKFYNTGLLLMGFVDQRSISNTYTAMLATAGSYMGYVHYTVDGLYFAHSSISAEIAADFEEFFLHLKDSRKNELTLDAGSGKPRGDVSTFEWQGKRLVLINNRNNTPQQYRLQPVNSQNMIAIDHETKTVFSDTSLLECTVPANQPRGILLLSRDALNSSKASVPTQLRCDKRNFPIIRWNPAQDSAAVSSSDFRYAFRETDLTGAEIQRCPHPLYQIPVSSAGRTVYYQVRSRLPDERSSAWSEITATAIPAADVFAHSGMTPTSGVNTGNTGSWLPYSWGGGSQLARFDMESSPGLSLHIENEFDTTQSYWTTFRPSMVLGSMPEIESGKQYEFTARIQRSGQIRSTISLRFLDREGKVVQQSSSEPVSGTKDWMDVKVRLTANNEAKYATFMFSGSGGPGACQADSLDFKLLP